MNGRELLEGLSLVDAVLVEEAELAGPRRRRLRPWLLAACVCLALAGTACAVGTLWSVQIGKLSTGGEEFGYSVYGTVRTVPDADFSQEVHEILADDWADWWAMDETSRMLSSTQPGTAYRKYETWAEGAEFLGLELANPLEEADWLEKATTAGMPLDGEHGRRIGAEHCEASLYGNEEGRVKMATLWAGYCTGDIRLILSAKLQTEYFGDMAADGSQAVETGSVWMETVNIAGSSLAMPDGQTAALVISQPRREDSYVAIEVYFIQGGLLYTLNVVGPDGGDEAVAAVRAVLEQALACFE